MPTPFMHLRAAHRFLHDDDVSTSTRKALRKSLGAFLLGNVAPDARVSGNMERADTHFFEYAASIDPHPVPAMLQAHPELGTATDARRAFIAGYVAHLAMDVIWAQALLFPQFYHRSWADQNTKFILLHALLIYLDERDYKQWDVAAFYDAIHATRPEHWLPFLPDDGLIEWRDLIANQICPDCESHTLPVLGSRVSVGEAGLRALLRDEPRMQAELWTHIPMMVVEGVEETMYRAMLLWINRYWEGM